MTTIDPAQHTVDEVRAHLEAHPEETDEVIEAEKKGKNRASLVNQPVEGVVFDRVGPESGALKIVSNES